MALTEVKLNGVYYKTKRLPTQVLANQMASKVGQGTSEYGDLTTWSAWIQQDWQEGVGKVKPHLNGGFLYGEVESRVPGQLILPGLLKQTDTRTITSAKADCRYMPTTVAGYIPMRINGTASIAKRIAIRFTTPAGFSVATQARHMFWFYAYADDNSGFLVSVYTNSANAPGTEVTSTSTTSDYTGVPGGNDSRWFGAGVTVTNMSAATDYWLVIECLSQNAGIAYGTSGYSDDTKAIFSTGSYVAQTGKYAVYTTNIHHMAMTANKNTGIGFFRFDGDLYYYVDATLFKYDAANTQWDSIGAITDHSSVTSAIVFDAKVYFGNGGITTTDYTTMNTSDAFTSTGVNGYLFAKHNGVLWRAYLNEVEYSEDGTTWEPSTTFGDPIYVSDTSAPVTGMCGMGEYMYVSTKEGLVVIMPGDFAKGVMPWGSIDSSNGTSMVNFEGAIYATVSGRIVRITEDGSMQDVWMTRDEDMIAEKIGKVLAITRMNNWLVVLVGGTKLYPTQDSLSSATIWAMQGNSWHHITTVPNAWDYGDDLKVSSAVDVGLNYAVFYDRDTQRLWIADPTRNTYSVRVPDYTLNPYNDTETVYESSGWVEWDWFDGAVLEAPKDYESVTIIGENLDATCYVQVYWKDDDSAGWELLGTCDSNNEELRWTIAMGTRPNTKRFKLGLRLVTTDGTQTPRIRAVRVKYHLMTRDWFRWHVIVDVSGRSGALQMLADGTRHTLTATQIKDNLDALARQIPPFLYQDVDGSQYEVKITDANFSYDRWEYNEKTTNTWWEGTYTLVLEQVTNAEYSA